MIDYRSTDRCFPFLAGCCAHWLPLENLELMNIRECGRTSSCVAQVAARGIDIKTRNWRRKPKLFGQQPARPLAKYWLIEGRERETSSSSNTGGVSWFQAAWVMLFNLCLKMKGSGKRQEPSRRFWHFCVDSLASFIFSFSLLPDFVEWLLTVRRRRRLIVNRWNLIAMRSLALSIDICLACCAAGGNALSDPLWTPGKKKKKIGF